MTLAGLVLAAGQGSRLGRPKALVTVAGERLVDRAVRALRAGGISTVVVVTGAAEVGEVDADTVHNPRWSEGIGSSLRAGLAALPPVTAALVVLVDQPGVTPAAVSRLAAQVGSENDLLAATYAGRRGHPVVIGRAWWSEVARTAVGDVGARPFLDSNAAVRLIECGDVASDRDVDTPEDLGRLQ